MARGRAETQRIDGWQGRHRRTTCALGQLGTVKFPPVSPPCQGVKQVGNPRKGRKSRQRSIAGAPSRVERGMTGLQALRFEALGGLCELYAAAPPRSAPAGASGGAADLPSVRAWVHRMHDRLSRFDPASEVSRLNAAAGRWGDG